MTSLDVQTRFKELVDPAIGRTSDSNARVVVQVGHCSVASGAVELSERIVERFSSSTPVVVTGCDGACYAAPSVIVTNSDGVETRLERVAVDDLELISQALDGKFEVSTPNATQYVESQHRLALEGCGTIAAESIDAYLASGGYSGLAKALQLSPEEVIQEVKDSGLRGRGGAYFPAGLKWEGARGFPAKRRYMIVNCEEGEPGLFKDRHLMEGVPHRLIEGACIAAYAANATEIIFYVNAEANLSADRMQIAIDQAREVGLIGENILGSEFSASVEIRRGAGGYVCGEETTLINTIEGYRREPRLRPPYPVEAGLWAQPTVINNAETLASVPFILSNGAEEFTKVGDGQDTGTKIINLSGAVQRPGLIEVPIGTTIREIIFENGGGLPDGRSLNIIGIGGPSSGVFPPSMLGTPIKPGFLHESGVMLGAGAIIAVDDSMSVLDVIRNLAQYNANESCGKCTPCREGTPRMVEMIDSISDGTATSSDFDELLDLAKLVNAASLCGLGQAAGNPILSGLHFFGDEIRELAGVNR